MAKDDIELLSVDDEVAVKKETKKTVTSMKVDDDVPVKRGNKKTVKKMTVDDDLDDLELEVSSAKANDMFIKKRNFKILLEIIIPIALVLIIVPIFGSTNKGLSKREIKKYTSLYVETLTSEFHLPDGYNISFVDFDNDKIPEMIVRKGKFIFRLYTIKDDKVSELKAFHVNGKIDPESENGVLDLYYNRGNEEKEWFYSSDNIYFSMIETIERSQLYASFSTKYDMNKKYTSMEATIEYQEVESSNVEDIVKEMLGKKNYTTKYDDKSIKEKSMSSGAWMLVCEEEDPHIESTYFKDEIIYIDNKLTEYTTKIYTHMPEDTSDEMIDITINYYKKYLNYSPREWGLFDSGDNKMGIYFKMSGEEYCSFIGGCDYNNLDYKNSNLIIGAYESRGGSCVIK